MFKFLDYDFNSETSTALFRYEGPDGVIFTEKVIFPASSHATFDHELLDRALFLAFIILGTSYYKARPTKTVSLKTPLTPDQAAFFNLIYQEGLSQFAFENHLTRADLATFPAAEMDDSSAPLVAAFPQLNDYRDQATSSSETSPALVLLSGGKDSLLTAEKLTRAKKAFRSVYISSGRDDYPKIVATYGAPLVIKRLIDRENLKTARFNGHVPVTFINESLALIQAALIGAHEIYVGLGREGEEPHAFLGDLAVNHQWSKTPAAQRALSGYLKTYVSKGLATKSLISEKSELEIAGEFVKLCWDKFGDQFSSCNVANYRQSAKNKSLKWCGKCPKCANSFLLFAPYLPPEKQPFDGKDLFKDPDLTETFKGLLGVDGVMKPFECIGEIKELREAYARRLEGYASLPFAVPEAT